MRLTAARSLFRRVPLKSIVHEKTPIASGNDGSEDDLLEPIEWFNEFAASPILEEVAGDNGMHKDYLVYAVKNLWELESMVRALDHIENLACMAHLMRSYVLCFLFPSDGCRADRFTEKVPVAKTSYWALAGKCGLSRAL